MGTRQYILGGILALVVVCATVLAALEVVPGERVIELLSVVVASFVGGLAGAGWRTPTTQAAWGVQYEPGANELPPTERPPPTDGT